MAAVPLSGSIIGTRCNDSLWGLRSKTIESQLAAAMAGGARIRAAFHPIMDIDGARTSVIALVGGDRFPLQHIDSGLFAAALPFVNLIDYRLEVIYDDAGPRILADAYLAWVILRWVVSNISSNGQPLPITFNGSVLTYIGWHVLLVISGITIVGWAWVIVAQTRWICRNIGGTNREILFRATGLEILWRTLVFAIACIFIIPIPWMLIWYVRWMVSQFELVERAA